MKKEIEWVVSRLLVLSCAVAGIATPWAFIGSVIGLAWVVVESYSRAKEKPKAIDDMALAKVNSIESRLLTLEGKLGFSRFNMGQPK